MNDAVMLINPSGVKVEVPTHFDIEEMLKQGFKLAEDQRRPESSEYFRTYAPVNSTSYFLNCFYTSAGLDADGYGRASRNFFRCMNESNVFVDFKKPRKLYLFIHHPHGIRHQLEVLEKTGQKPEYKVAYSMWETSRLPDGWTDIFNLMDELIVPSNFCKRVFEDSGVTKKMSVIPFPIDTESFYFKRRDPDRLPFIFMQHAQMTPRKGYQFTVEAFLKEFKKDEPVRLVIKSRRQIDKTSEDPRIEWIGQTWDEDHLVRKLHEADAFVNPSMGEGFGMCDMEAMSTGLASISMYEHALKDHLGARYSYLLKENEEIPVTYDDMQSWLSDFRENRTMGTWFRPSVDELRRAMRRAYQERLMTVEKGVRAAEAMRFGYSFAALRSKIRTWFYERRQWLEREDNGRDDDIQRGKMD